MITEKKYILILGKGPTQGLEHTLSAEKMYSINFIEHNEKLCLSLYYNGANRSKRFRDCSNSISKGWTVDNMKKNPGLNGHVYDFSVDYDEVVTAAIPHIHKYLIIKNGMV